MKNETVDRLVDELREWYADTTTAKQGEILYARLPRVSLPRGCNPGEMEAMVVLDPGQQKPGLLLRAKPRLPNGRDPKNVNPVTVLGEGWFQYSFNLAWDENQHTAEQFVEGSLRRFALNE